MESKKNIVILGTGQIAQDIADQIIKSGSLSFSGFIKESNSVLPEKFKKYDLGINMNVLKKIQPDLCVALDYHKIIPDSILKYVKIVNSHAGILPWNRGYHTSGWGFINRDKELGYSLHLMDKGIDSGPVIYTFNYRINQDTTFNDLKNAIYNDQKKNIVKILKSYLSGKIIAMEQKVRFPKYYGKRNLADCYIEWNMTSEYIYNFIKALSLPSGPGAFTVYKNKKLIILNSEYYLCEDYEEIPGHVLFKDDDKVLVKTKDKCLWIEDVIYNNKKLKAGKLINTTGGRLGFNIIEELLKNKKII